MEIFLCMILIVYLADTGIFVIFIFHISVELTEHLFENLYVFYSLK